jgi:RNA polymerase sigma-70 factor, ECF subfamily
LLTRPAVKTNPFLEHASDTSAAPWCYSSSVSRTGLDDEALCRQYGPMVLRQCRRLLRNEEEALDACQDVFVRVLERQQRLDLTSPSSLLYRIATNVCLNRIRDRKHHPVTSDEPLLAAIAAADEPGGASDARLVLDWLFGRHPESTRTMAVLHFVDGLTFEEVARHTGLSVSGVRRRLRKLREMLVEVARV